MANGLCGWTGCKDPLPSTKKRYCLKHRAEYMRKWRKTHPLTPAQRLKDNARSVANVYQSRGKLVSEPCETCGARCWSRRDREACEMTIEEIFPLTEKAVARPPIAVAAPRVVTMTAGEQAVTFVWVASSLAVPVFYVLRALALVR